MKLKNYSDENNFDLKKDNITLCIIALYGGSFNPPHRGHFETMRFINNLIALDNIWMLFSLNRFKDENDYAALKHRIFMAKTMAKFYADLPIVFSEYEHQINKHGTYDVLNSLRKDYPDCKFIWIMGADNLLQFHTWGQYEKIIEEFPIIVINRDGFGKNSLNSITAKQFKHLQKDNAKSLISGENGWVFIDTIPTKDSSTEIREKLTNGTRSFNSVFDTVIPYILEHHLYGTGK